MSAVPDVPSTPAAELWHLDALGLAARIRHGEVSAREAVAAHLARIEALNPGLNAVTRTLAGESLREAAEADRRRAAGEPAGPLHGVPFTVKENVDVAGTPTTNGLAAFAEAVAPVDAPAVAGLRAAGAIPIARTNLPDFALRWHTDSGVAGETRNPHDRALTPGGSSGGEAAALAAGLTPLGVGNDLGGSLRWPAQCCGIAALRPSLGRVAHAHAVLPADEPFSLAAFNANGPMARTVADLRAALAAMSRPDARDPWQVPRGGDAPALPRRAAVVTDPLGAGVDPGVADGVARAAQALEAAGWEVEAAEPPALAEAAELWGGMLAADLRRLLPVLAPLASPGAAAFMERAMAALPVLDGDGYAQALVRRTAIAREWAAFQAQRPVVLAPIATAPPFPPGADIDPAVPFESMAPAMRMITPVNLLGLPAAAVPVAGPAGGPGAVQLIGPRYREDACLDAGAAVEAALGAPSPVTPS